MPATYNTAVLNDRLQVVIDAIDAGAGSGLIKLGTAAMGITLSTIVLNKPCATIAAGVLTFSGLPLVDGAAATSGTAAAATVSNSSGIVVISGLTVGTVGTNIIITDTVIASGDIVTFVSGTITGN